MTEQAKMNLSYPDLNHIGLDKIRKLLKHKPRGDAVIGYIAYRVGKQIEDPQNDNMSTANILIANKYASWFTGKILDVGCMGGWLYGYMQQQGWLDIDCSYYGIDNWPEAIEAAKSLFPRGRFERMDAFDVKGEYDLIWASQLRPDISV